MEELEEKIRHLKRKRYEFFLHNPKASEAEYIRELKENSSKLLEEIPINVGQALHHYFVGKILNICPDYDANAEESLNRALRLDSTNADAWLELGSCVWKKPDVEKAYTCFKEACQRKRSAKTLAKLCVAIRGRLSKMDDIKERLKLLKECVDISKEAVAVDPKYAFAWMSLGNTYLCRFLMVGQLASRDMTLAMEAFATAQEQESFVNADLHLNYATALWYAQKYSDALHNFRKALDIEPHFATASSRLESLESFLDGFSESIAKKGRLPARKFKDMIRLLSDKDWGPFGAPITVEGKSITFERKLLSELTVGANKGLAVCLRIIGIVPNADEIPSTMVAADAEGSVVGVTVFNCSRDFGVIIGDTFAIPDPLVVEVKDFTVRSKPMDFRTIRVDNPMHIVRNGKPLRSSDHAYAAVSFQHKGTEIG